MANVGEEFERVHGVVKHGLNELEPHPLLVKPSEVEVKKAKTLGAMKTVYSYWQSQLEGAEGEGAKTKLIENMKACVNHEVNTGNEHLEAASSNGHSQWVRFVKTHQKNKLNPDHPEYNKSIVRQVNSKYKELSENEKDLHRTIVSFVTGNILTSAKVRASQKPV